MSAPYPRPAALSRNDTGGHLPAPGTVLRPGAVTVLVVIAVIVLWLENAGHDAATALALAAGVGLIATEIAARLTPPARGRQ
ncbi:hypothetical protein ACQEU3_37470 [Spirillospora sp. CA-253888]